MALKNKTTFETGSKKSTLIECKEGSVQLLTNENILDSISQLMPAKDVTKEQNDLLDSSTISDECKSIVGSPPDCNNKHLENYTTPHSQRHADKHKEGSLNINANLSKNSNIILEQTDQRKIPEAIKKWPECVEVWLNMVYNEEATLRSRSNSSTRNGILPRMRAILIDWIMEVCEVYQLRRNTYYLAVDYIDRFLDHKRPIPKTQLQLVGVTCLFIAAKVEEIYPPKLTEFAYVCDGACTEKEILTCERLVLSFLGWDVNPMTPSNWLNLYMQIACIPSKIPQQLKIVEDSGAACNNNPTNTEIYFPVYSAYQFVRASQIMDLFSFDPGYARFCYSVIAASAMQLECGEADALAASGLSRESIDLCLAHMSFFQKVLDTEDNPRLLSVLGNLAPNSFASSAMNSTNTVDEIQAASYRAIRKTVPNLVQDEKHTMQTHCIDLDYYERAIVLRLEWLGFKVKKMYSKQYKVKCNNCCKSPELIVNCNCDNKVEDEPQEPVEENGEDGEPPDFSTVVMFQLERLSDVRDDGNASDEDVNAKVVNMPKEHDVHSDKNSNSNIFALSTSGKQLFNFDSILSSVHNDCNDKTFMTLWRQTNSV